MNRILNACSVVTAMAIAIGCQEPIRSERTVAVPMSQDGIAAWQKMDGPERFMTYHRLIRTRSGMSKPAYKSGDVFTAFTHARGQRRTKRAASLPWIERGPGNVGGRTRGLWVDPSDPDRKTIFVGSAGGGIWKTEDGLTWRNLTPHLPNLATTTIAGSAAAPQVLYAGTGEGFGAARNIVGSGLWKSTDAGESWSRIEATAQRDDIAVVYRVIANPADADEFLFSTLIHPRAPLEDSISSIMKSVDGGLHVRSTYVSDRAIQQLVADPTDFNIIYAVINGEGVLKSQDRGDTWTPILEVDSFRRMEMAVSPTHPDFLYLSAELRSPNLDNTGSSSASRLLTSSDGGSTWMNVQREDASQGFGDWFGGQGWYNNCIAVHPYDSNQIYVGGAGAILQITVERFDTSGRRYIADMQPVTDGYGTYRQSEFAGASSKGVHVDHHNIQLVPIDKINQAFYFYDANDGGVALSFDGGATFIQTGDSFKEECIDPGCTNMRTFKTLDGYNTAQFYGVDKANGMDRYVGGTQDNGSWISMVDPEASSKWIQAPGGDGFETVWHYNDLNKIIETAQFNTMFRSDDGGVTWRQLQTPGLGPFLTRLAGSKQEPNLIFAVTTQGLIKSIDFGESWKVIEMPEQWQSGGLPTPTRISLATPNVVWSGASLSAESSMTVSQDGGNSFSPISPYLTAELGIMTNVATHPLDDSTAYFLFSQANGPKIIRTEDLGQTLEDISGFGGNQNDSDNGYPDVATYCLLVMPYDDQILWAGTEIGLFESTDRGLSWQYSDNGLPPASIWEMKIVNDQVIVATHGRGIWSVSLPELDGYEPPAVTFLSPELATNDYALDGMVWGAYNLRTAYDSTVIQFIYLYEGDTITITERFGENEAPKVDARVTMLSPLPAQEIVEVDVVMKSYQQGVPLMHLTSLYAFSVQDEVASDYFNDFEAGQHDFATLNTFYSSPVNFSDRSLNTPHPYQGLSEYAAIFQKPIVVGPGTSDVSFNEIVLVEPGDSEPFPSSDFYDYCVIEATADRGASWQVIAGYDSRAESIWASAYKESPNTATPALRLQRTFDLQDFFDEGDTTFVRFRLVSDPFVEGWGWQLDEFQVGTMAVGIDDLDKARDLGVQIHGNPSGQDLLLWLHPTYPVEVILTLLNLSGQKLSSEKIHLHEARYHSVRTGNLSSGVYMLHVQAEGQQQTLRWVKN